MNLEFKYFGGEGRQISDQIRQSLSLDSPVTQEKLLSDLSHIIFANGSFIGFRERAINEKKDRLNILVSCFLVQFDSNGQPNGDT